MTQDMSEKWTDDNRCFACGKRNPIGLKMDFEPNGSGWKSTFTPSPDHQGWQGVCHGGIVATVLDEVMAQCVQRSGITAVTARLQVDFKQPISTGGDYEVWGRIVQERRKIIEAEARLTDPEGAVGARAKGTYFVIERD